MSLMVTPDGILSLSEARDYSDVLLVDGSRAGATSSLQTFTNGIVTGIIRPAADGADGVVITNVAGDTNHVSVNTSNGNVEVGGDLRMENNARISMKDSGGTYRTMFRLTGSDVLTTGTSASAVTRHNLESGGPIYFTPGTVQGRWTTDGYLSVGQNADGTAYVDIVGSDTGAASLRLRSGTAPTSPNSGDIWYPTSGRLTFRRDSTTEIVATGVQQTGGAATAGASYTSTEQDMLQDVYDAAREFGLLD